MPDGPEARGDDLGPRLERHGPHLHFDGVDLTDLAARYGTPLYAYSAGRLRDNAQTVIEAFRARHANVTVAYASKACALLPVLKILRGAGCAIEVNSQGELHRARVAGVPDDAIVLNGVAKSESELAAAVTPPIKAINVNSPRELARLAEVARQRGVRANVSLRLVPELASGTAPGLETASSGSKFGMDSRELAQALEILRDGADGLELVGLHVHIGSQITGTEGYRAAAAFIAEQSKQVQAATGQRLRHINVGGGFPVDYTRGNASQTTPAFLHSTISEHDIAEAVLAPLKSVCGDRIEILVEPGRRMVADAGLLLSRVEDLKERDGERWLVLDAGYHTILETFSYKWFFPMVPVDRGGGEQAAFRVVGPLCDTGDSFSDVDGEAAVAQLLAQDPGLSAYQTALESTLIRLPRTRTLPAESNIGDLIAFTTAGAYTMDQLFAVNGRGRPAVVLIEGGGRTRVIRRADSLLDQLLNEIVE